MNSDDESTSTWTIFALNVNVRNEIARSWKACYNTSSDRTVSSYMTLIWYVFVATWIVWPRWLLHGIPYFGSKAASFAPMFI